jgi:hypothetical protein
VVWSEPNISQIEAWSSTIYARYQEFEFEFVFELFFLNEKNSQFFFQKFKKNNNFLKLKKLILKTKNQIQIIDTRHKLRSSQLQFEIYLVPTKSVVVPETI